MMYCDLKTFCRIGAYILSKIWSWELYDKVYLLFYFIHQTWFPYIVQADFELMIALSQPPKC